METKMMYSTPECEDVNIIFESCILSTTGEDCTSDDGGMEEGGEV